MRDSSFFALTSSEYFEPLWQYPIGLRYWHLVRDLIPEDWTLERSEIWLKAQPAAPLAAEQGFKIHLSATPGSAEEILRRVVPELAGAGITFKLAADPEMVWLVNSKNYDRGGSGKFLVAYPPTLEQFTSLIERLYTLTRGLEGPYILSDRRYKDSKVVYYRYGAFRPLLAMTVDGRRTLCLRDPAGELVPDERVPYFQLPAWVSDPFPPGEEADEPDDGILKGRYRIESAIAFSNAGGVYQGTDLETGERIVVKEARPWTRSWEADAMNLREREFRALRRLEGLPWVPKVIDFFQEWEHLFLVEQFVAGVPLFQYRAAEHLMLTIDANRARRVRSFCKWFHQLAHNLMRMLDDVHRRGIVIGDLSPNNLLFDPQSQTLTLIDLEGAIDLEAPQRTDAHVSQMYTPGFRRADRTGGVALSPEDDFFAASMILYNVLIPIQSFFWLKPEAEELFIDAMEQCFGLPGEVGQVILALMAGDGREAGRILARWQRSGEELPPWEERRAALDRRLRQALAGIGSHLLASYDTTRDDRLWPGDIELYLTNPLSLAYGTGGPLLLLKDLGHGIPADVEPWLRARQPRAEAYPPGLCLGLAGMAQVFAEVGYEDLAAAALEESYRSPLVFAAADYFHGAAGWGLVQLWFFDRWQEPRYLARAGEAGERILAAAERRRQGLCWRNPLDGRVHFGLAHGASGVALFLLHLYRATRDDRWRTAAEAAVRFDLGRAENPRGRMLQWREHEESGTTMIPYWLHGSAGVASVLTRFCALLGEPEYGALAARCAAYAHASKFAFQPTQFEGLAGLGEAALDLFVLIGEERFLRTAYGLAESILLYGVERAEGLAFPGRALLRLSTDYGTGSAGIGLFLHRLLHPGPRRFHDLAAPAAAAARQAEPAERPGALAEVAARML
jgi:hypothetical protein